LNERHCQSKILNESKLQFTKVGMQLLAILLKEQISFIKPQ